MAESDSDDSEPPLTNEEVAERTGASLSEVCEYREIFQLVDLDGGGSIDGEELGELMDLLGELFTISVGSHVMVL